MRKMSSVNTFLVEIIIVTLFFSFCVAITLQLFVEANTKSSLNFDTSIATIKVQAQAETIKGLDKMDDAETAFSYAKRDVVGKAVEYQLFYDKKWNQTKTNPRYIIDVKLEDKLTQHSKMLIGTIEAVKIRDKKRERLFFVETKKYIE